MNEDGKKKCSKEFADTHTQGKNVEREPKDQNSKPVFRG